jgi:hypothetical protein
MITIADIKPVDRPPYKEIIGRGTERAEVDAPVLQFYEVVLQCDDGKDCSFGAEVRSSPHGEQIDWDDDLDDFLFDTNSVEKAEEVRRLISSRIAELRKNTEPRSAGDGNTRA